MTELLEVCDEFEPPGPDRLTVYSVISPLASRGRCQTTAIEDDDRFVVDTSTGAELGTENKQKNAPYIYTSIPLHNKFFFFFSNFSNILKY